MTEYQKLAEELYHKYRNMIRNFAWRYSLCGTLDFYELEAQGNLIFMETLNKYNEQRAMFSTYLYLNLDRDMSKYIKRQYRESWPVIESSQPVYDNFVDNVCHKDIKSRLSRETTGILDDLANGLTIYKNSRRLNHKSIKELRTLIEQ